MAGKVEDANFSKETDNFSLAIHLFRLLMNNSDPFGARVLGRNVNSKTVVPLNQAIINGECPHFRSIPNKEVPPAAPKLDLLPQDLAQAFDRTFNYTQLTVQRSMKNRTTAEEWNRLLLKYAQAEPNPNLKRCTKVASHVYPIHHTTCPFCSANAHKKKKGFFRK